MMKFLLLYTKCTVFVPIFNLVHISTNIDAGLVFSLDGKFSWGKFFEIVFN